MTANGRFYCAKKYSWYCHKVRHSGRSVILLDNFFAEDVSQIEEIESHEGFEAQVALFLTIAIGCNEQTS